MDVREKLMKLVKNALAAYGSETNEVLDTCKFIADFMMAHGITVQDNTEITDKFLKQLRNAPLTVLHEEPTIEVVQDWISVKDRLPETNGYHVWVIACVDGKRSCVRMFERKMVRGKMVERFKYPWEAISDDNITHWCYLPQPPKGE